MQTVRVKFTAPGEIRVFQIINGRPVGRGILIKTAIDFSTFPRDDLPALIKMVILSNWRVVVRLNGGRLK